MIRVGVVCMAAMLAFAPQAVAVGGKLKAKFKVVSASGSQSVSFHEESSDSTGERCVGTTTAEFTWRTTPPKTIYVFVKGAGKRARPNISADRVAQAYDVARLPGKATVSRSVDYQETAGCHRAPTACPKATGPATLYLLGTRGRLGSVESGIDVVRLPEGLDASCEAATSFAPGLTRPFGTDAVSLFPRLTVYAWAIPRSRLLDPHRKRVKDSKTVKQPFSGSDPEYGATLSGRHPFRMGKACPDHVRSGRIRSNPLPVSPALTSLPSSPKAENRAARVKGPRPLWSRRPRVRVPSLTPQKPPASHRFW